jgi:hypothetical protein
LKDKYVILGSHLLLPHSALYPSFIGGVTLHRAVNLNGSGACPFFPPPSPPEVELPITVHFRFLALYAASDNSEVLVIIIGRRP